MCVAQNSGVLRINCKRPPADKIRFQKLIILKNDIQFQYCIKKHRNYTENVSFFIYDISIQYDDEFHL